MVTPINAVRFHYGFGEADFCLRDEEDFSSFQQEEVLAPARGATFGLVVGGLMWAVLIAGFRAIVRV